MFCYALYSKTAETFDYPFFAHDDKEAIEVLGKYICEEGDEWLIDFLDDFQLYKVGWFRPKAEFPLDGHTVSPDLVLDDLHETLTFPPVFKYLVDQLSLKKEVYND